MPFPARAERRVLIALDDALHGRLPKAMRGDIPTPNGFVVRYVHSAALADPRRDADAWLGAYEATAPGRSQVFQCGAEVYEQDSGGLMYLRGSALWPTPPAHFGLPLGCRGGQMAVGEQLALLFLQRVTGGWHVRVRCTPPLTRIIRPPTVERWGAVPANWLALAQGVLIAEVDGIAGE